MVAVTFLRGAHAAILQSRNPPGEGGAGEGSSRKKRKLLVEQRENWQVCI